MSAYHFTHPLRHKQDVTQEQFLSGVQWFEFVFPSPRLIGLPWLKNAVYLTIYPLLGDKMKSYLFEGY